LYPPVVVEVLVVIFHIQDVVPLMDFLVVQVVVVTVIIHQQVEHFEELETLLLLVPHKDKMVEMEMLLV
tara:strand:+ start:156 stop:362 length:207 start_codon:yes stop_codon:yes gene_type:complete